MKSLFDVPVPDPPLEPAVCGKAEAIRRGAFESKAGALDGRAGAAPAESHAIAETLKQPVASSGRCGPDPNPHHRMPR
jgi:hypothetical protein